MSLSSTYISRKELIADNLQSMGVLSADENDGLTTLANKILDIEPSISGLDLDTSIILHSSDNECLIGQSIMFWAELKANYNDETPTDVDLSGVLTGATISFKNGNTVLGTAVTDSDGIAYYIHTFSSTGDYNITADFAGTDNFDDCVSSSIAVSVSYGMSITADKSILSYNNHDVATITASLFDGDGGVSGETLSYELLDKNDNVLDSGSDVTDPDGEISFTYQSTGVGDVSVVVYYGLSLQETFAIEDNYHYDDATTDRTSEYTVQSGMSLSHSTDHYVLTTSQTNRLMTILSTLSDARYEIVMKQPSQNGQSGVILSETTNTLDNSVYSIFSTDMKLTTVNNDVSTQSSGTSQPQSSRTNYHKFIFEVVGSSITLTYKDASDNTIFTKTTTKSFTNKYFGVFNSNATEIHIDSIKIKAL